MNNKQLSFIVVDLIPLFCVPCLTSSLLTRLFLSLLFAWLLFLIFSFSPKSRLSYLRLSFVVRRDNANLKYGQGSTSPLDDDTNSVDCSLLGCERRRGSFWSIEGKLDFFLLYIDRLCKWTFEGIRMAMEFLSKMRFAIAMHVFEKGVRKWLILESLGR